MTQADRIKKAVGDFGVSAKAKLNDAACQNLIYINAVDFKFVREGTAQ